MKYAGHGQNLRAPAVSKYVKYWLYLIYLLLLAIIIIGGITRLTGSGLSITQWKPIHGIIPPLSYKDWQEEFAAYKQIAQYRELNFGINLAEFKQLFWWEWTHRLLARMIGFIVIIPLILFWLTNKLDRRLKWNLVGLFLLGSLQGVIGWWMVSSGLGNSQLTSVSQYRLAIHLSMAAIIMTAVLALARSLSVKHASKIPLSLRIFSALMVVLILLQIFMGAIVAGLHAGLVANSWPLMEGSLLPTHLFKSMTSWHSIFEEPRLAQFIHRSIAYIVFIMALLQAFYSDKLLPQSRHARRCFYLFLLVLAQAAIGVITLLTYVPIFLAILHQIFAFILLSYAIINWQDSRRTANHR